MIKRLPYKLEILIFFIVAFILFKVDFSVDNASAFYFKKEDIYYEYLAAKQIQANENPYLRILDSNMLENDKYATQLPLYFYSLAALRSYSKDDFSGFIENFRVVLFYAQLVGGFFIYLTFRKANNKFLGFVAAILYMFNVWSFNSIIYLKQDMLAIAFLLGSFYFFGNSKYRWISYIAYGLSLGIKHIGIFVFPIFLVPLIFKLDNSKTFVRNLVLLALTVLVPTVPLFLDNPSALINSILFSATRAPIESEITYGYSTLLIKYNAGYNTGTLFQQLLPRLPLFIAYTLCVILLFFKKIPVSVFVFASLLVFAIFNPVIFPQYITWVAPFALLSIIDYLKLGAIDYRSG